MKLIERFGMLQVLHEVGPARVGLELAVAGHGVDFARAPGSATECRVAAARDVEGRQVERQTEQVVAQRFGDELIDLVADLPRQAANDGAGGLLGVGRWPRSERIEESGDQTDARRSVIATLKFGSKRSTVSVSIE